MSAAAREHVVQLLCGHFAEDHLSVDELEQRLEAAYKADTPAKLDLLLADLPVPAPPAPAGSPASAAPVPSPSAARAPVDAPAHGRIVAMLGESKRRGNWVLPRTLDVTAIMASALIDLRSAQIATGESVIQVSALMAEVKILLPPDVRVECDGITIMATFATDGVDWAGSATSPARIVHITGTAVMADVRAIHGVPAGSLGESKKGRRARLVQGEG